MAKRRRGAVACARWLAAAVCGALCGCGPDRRAERMLAGYRPGQAAGDVAVECPFDGTLFPPDLAAPLFRWRAEAGTADVWLVLFGFAGGEQERFVTDAPEWRPSPAQWRRLKARCVGQPVTVTVLGARAAEPGRVVCSASVRFGVAAEPVGAPIFFREVNLPFSEAVKDPSRIRWRLGSVASERPPRVVLEGLPVCGNCHSFSRGGRVLGMDVDYANDKGSYVTAEVEPEVELTREKILTWSDFRREDGQQTFGLLSQVSPDGRYVIGTVKDRSVFLAMPKVEFSQLFFPIQGILAVYDRQTGRFAALPGADDPEYVQSNPTWSPDGRTVVFARSRAYRLRSAGRTDAVLLRRDECDEFLKEGMAFRYDLCRIPFNGGKGGAAEPLKGASANGRSNYFAKYSPDGRWIVFCQAASFMLLQPDSELYIVAAEGGAARRLACNLPCMNSWHSWSPNSRWLVFASKPGTPFTRLFLTHIDEQGSASPAVLLDGFAAANRAANIPEFVDLRQSDLRCLRARFVDASSYVRAGNAFRDGGDRDKAVELYRKALGLAPGNVEARVGLGAALVDAGQLPEAVASLEAAVAASPGSSVAWYNLAVARAKQADFDEAIRCCAEAVRLDPASASARSNLGIFLMEKGRFDEACVQLAEAVRLDPKKENAHFALGRLLVRRGQLAEAARCYEAAARLAPDERTLTALAWLLATAPDPGLRDGPRAVELASRLCELTKLQSPRALDILGASYAEAGRFQEACRAAAMAAEAAQRQGNGRLASEIAARGELYRQGRPFHQ